MKMSNLAYHHPFISHWNTYSHATICMHVYYEFSGLVIKCSNYSHISTKVMTHEKKYIFLMHQYTLTWKYKGYHTCRNIGLYYSTFLNSSLEIIQSRARQAHCQCCKAYSFPTIKPAYCGQKSSKSEAFMLRQEHPNIQLQTAGDWGEMTCNLMLTYHISLHLINHFEWCHLVQ